MSLTCYGVYGEILNIFKDLRQNKKIYYFFFSVGKLLKFLTKLACTNLLKTATCTFGNQFCFLRMRHYQFGFVPQILQRHKEKMSY